MKKTYIFIFLILLSSTLATAELEVEKIDKGSTILAGLTDSAKFEFVINNKGEEDVFSIYSLVSVEMGPKNYFVLPEGITRMSITAKPFESVRKPGMLRFEYQIKGRNSGIFKDVLSIKIIELEDAIEIETEPIHPSEKETNVKIKNKENIFLENLSVEIDSPFFSTEKKLSLSPYEEISFPVEISQDKTLTAGPYIINSIAKIGPVEAEIESLVDYLEKEGTSVDTKTEGIIVKKTAITKTNEGNTQTTAKIEVKKDIISRFFTYHSTEPKETDRQGLVVYYNWEKELLPGESFSVTTTTNYTLPVIVVIIIILVVLIIKKYSQTALVLKKNVSFIRTKGGEFALKVKLHVKAKKHVDKIQLIDVLPRMTKLYEKFGLKPTKVDDRTGRLFWSIPSLTAGEERVISYIIYSKLNIIGRFELPSATAIYESNGKTIETFSNRAFFAREESE